MAIVPVIGLIETIVQKIWPDKSKQEQAQLALAMAANEQFTQLLLAQSDINKEEAKSENVFVSGARPAALWICVAAFAWQFVVMPILLFVNAEFGHQVPVPLFDTTTMIGILTGMLGLGTMRSVDKFTAVNKN